MSGLLGLWGRDLGGVVSEKFISALAEHGAIDPKNKEDFQSISSQITNLLGTAATRYKGLLILKSLFKAEVIDDNVLINHGQTWLPLCIKTLKPLSVSSHEKALSISVIREILDASSRIHELERNVVSASLPELVENLVKCQPELHSSVLSCLYTLLLCHSKSSGAFKVPFEKFLIQFLDSDNKDFVVLAARCTHLLQQVQGGGELKINHKIAWKSQLELCIRSCHILLKELFKISQINNYQDISFFDQSNSEPMVNNTKVSKGVYRPFEIAFKNMTAERKLYCFLNPEKDDNTDDDVERDVSKSVVLKVDMLMTRLENVLVFIQALLVEPFPVMKQINCVSLLEVLMSCLSLKCRITNQEVTVDTMAVILKVPGLRSTVMQTIKALIVCLSKDITPYSFLILKMVLQVLDESKMENSTGKVKLYRNSRKIAYNTLSYLLSILHTLKPPPKEGDSGFEDQLINNIMYDIIPRRSSMELTVKKIGSLKQMGKRARRKLAKLQLESSNLPQNFGNPNSSNTNLISTNKSNEDLILAALSCLDAFLKSSGVFLKKNTHKIIQESLVKEVYSESLSSIINEAFCKTLLTMQCFQSHLLPVPLPYCLDVYSRNQNNFHFNTAFNAMTSLSYCMSLTHGIAPPLNFCHERISQNENKLQNSNNDDHVENEDIIDLDNYSNDNQKHINSVIDNTENTGSNDFRKRKSDNNREEVSKQSKYMANSDNGITDENSSITVHIDIADSDSESSLIQSKNNFSKSSKITDETINLVNNLSDDENNDIVFMETNNIPTATENYALTDDLDKTVKKSIDNDINDSETIQQNIAKCIDLQSAGTSGVTVESTDGNKDNSSQMPSQIENLNSEIGVSVEEMMNALVDEVQEEFE